MTLRRRTLLAAALALAPAVVVAKPKARRCKGRAPYAGPPPRASLSDAVFGAAAAAGRTRLQPLIDEGLEAGFEKAFAAQKSQALTAAVAMADGGLWTQTRIAGTGRLPERFFWASVGKAYTATAVLQLVEEGRVTLDAPLDRWAPDMPNAQWITVEDLLAHTSGLYSFQADPALRAEPGYKPPERLLAAAQAQPASFCPGAAWSYCNTGYVLLGKIIEAVEGRSYQDALKARIVERLDLRETIILAPGRPVQGLAAPVWAGAPDGTGDDIATPFAAGGVVASAADVVRFWRAMLAGRLHGQAVTRARFARLYPMTGVGPSFYGQGVMVSDLARVDPRATDTWLGHAGGLPGASATVAYSVEKNAYVAVALTGEGSPEATANLLLAGLVEPPSGG